MTDGPHAPGLHLLADLTVDVDGVPAQVHADGSELIVETEHPTRLAQAARRSLPPGTAGTRAVAAAAGQLLADQGLTVRLRGPRGPVGAIGAAVDSPVGAVLAGSRRISVAVPPLVPRLVAAGAVLATLAWTVRRSRGR